jgi:probable HAF family extracellular repeat protein
VPWKRAFWRSSVRACPCTSRPLCCSTPRLLDKSAWAYSINSSGQVVGWRDTAVRSNDHAFIYANGTMTDLNKLLAGSIKSSGVILTTTLGINDAGQITGVATVNGHARAYLLTPNI